MAKVEPESVRGERAHPLLGHRGRRQAHQPARRLREAAPGPPRRDARGADAPRPVRQLHGAADRARRRRRACARASSWSRCPGAPEQAPTRKQLLDQVDGVVLVIDAEPRRIDENAAIVEELRKGARRLRAPPRRPAAGRAVQQARPDGRLRHRRAAPAARPRQRDRVRDGGHRGPRPAPDALDHLEEGDARAARREHRDAGAAPPAVPAAGARPAPRRRIARPARRCADSETRVVARPARGAARARSRTPSSRRPTRPDAIELDAELSSAESLLEAPWPDGRCWPPLGARIGRDLAIVSVAVGAATRVDDAQRAVPLVLGDGVGETSTLVLTIRLDPAGRRGRRG